MELGNCPSCGLTKDECDATRTNYHIHEDSWARFKPMIYHDRLLDRWVIECKNCGMVVIFGQNKKDENIELWNQLPRKEEP